MMMLDTKIEAVGSIFMIIMSIFLFIGNFIELDFTFGHPEIYWVVFYFNDTIIIFGSLFLFFLGILSLLICLGNFKMKKRNITLSMIILGIITFGLAGAVILLGALFAVLGIDKSE